METNEIKKTLYKQKPLAKFDCITGGVAYYKTQVDIGNIELKTVTFGVPVSEMGETTFGSEMDAKLLNRYIIS